MNSPLLPLVERIREALEANGPLSIPRLKQVLGDPVPPLQLDQALRFLVGRDTCLVDAVDETVHLRSTVIAEVIKTLAEAGSLSLENLITATSVSSAVCCDVLGWLEREGRLSIDRKDLVSLRSTPRQRPDAPA